MGRATRLCPEIEKELFVIYDAVDLYAALEPYTSMKPVVPNPNISFVQLVTELRDLKDEAARDEVPEQIIAKLQRKKRSLKGESLDNFIAAAAWNPTN